MKFNRFTKGTGVYSCDCCGRRTRDTGEGAMNGICGLCYELAGYENLIQDGEELSKRDIQEIIRLVQAVYKADGKRVWDDLLAKIVAICQERAELETA